MGWRGLSFGPERTDYEPERGLGGGQTDIRTYGRTSGKSAEILHKKTAVDMLSDKKKSNFVIGIVFPQYNFCWLQLLLKTGYVMMSHFSLLVSMLKQ